MSLVRKIFSFTLTFGLIAALVIGVVYRQRIADQMRVWSYEPSSAIVNLADRSGFSGEGRFYFYVTHPKLESADQFNDDCRRVEKGSPILGCYIQGADTIHIYDIQNPELDGIKEVTAAHEMLHSVFARLSDDDKRALAAQLEAAYGRHKTPKLEERMDYYERNQPGSRINELHSIIGTEFSDIGSELEAYYARYFADRQKIVALHQSYSQKFDDLEAELESLSVKMKQQSEIINQNSAKYQVSLESFNSRVAVFNTRASNGDFSSQGDFNRERSRFISEAAQLDSLRLETLNLIDEYNRNVERLNELGGKMNQLNRSLDSLQEIGS